MAEIRTPFRRDEKPVCYRSQKRPENPNFLFPVKMDAHVPRVQKHQMNVNGAIKGHENIKKCDRS